MNNLIPISYDNPERPTVSGRELHDFLEVGADYRHWFPRMCEYGFTEGEDFNSVKIDRVQNEGGRMVSRTLDDHQLTIPMAKELCMIQRNERGKQARQYFLAVEAQWNSPEAVMRRAVLIADRKVKELQSVNRSLLAENNELKPDAEYARAVCVGNIPRKRFDEAVEYIQRWKPSTNTVMLIQQTNGQTSLFAAAAAQRNTTTSGKLVKEV